MKKKSVKKNIENGTIESSFVPLIDYVRENRLNYSKVYQSTLNGKIKSIRKGNRIYIDMNSIRMQKKRTVL